MRKRYIAIEPIVADERVCDSDRAIYWADEVDQRIAELEHSIDVLQTTAKHINSAFFETAIKYLESELSNRKSVNTTIDNPQS